MNGKSNGSMGSHAFKMNSKYMVQLKTNRKNVKLNGKKFLRSTFGYIRKIF